VQTFLQTVTGHSMYSGQQTQTRFIRIGWQLPHGSQQLLW